MLSSVVKISQLFPFCCLSPPQDIAHTQPILIYGYILIWETNRYSSMSKGPSFTKESVDQDPPKSLIGGITNNQLTSYTLENSLKAIVQKFSIGKPVLF